MSKNIYNYYFNSTEAFASATTADCTYNVNFSNLPQGKKFKGSIVVLSRSSGTLAADDIFFVNIDMSAYNNCAISRASSTSYTSTNNIAIGSTVIKGALNCIDIKNTDNAPFILESTPMTPYIRIRFLYPNETLLNFNANYILLLSLEEI